MSDFKAAWRQSNASMKLTIRELAISADLAAWAGDDDRCTVIIARIYEAFDDLSDGLAPHARTLMLAADAAAWIEGRSAGAAEDPLSCARSNEMITLEVARQ